MKRWLLLLFVMSLGLCSDAQVDDSMRSQYERFRNQVRRQYEDFRDKANREYAEFLRRAWQEYNVLPAIPRPKDEEVPPVVIPEDERTQPIESSPVTIEDIIESPVIKPQPVPVAPIENVPRPTESFVAFMFYGTECKVRFDDGHRFAIGGMGGDVLSRAWLQLSCNEYDNLISDCLELRTRMRLCDWAYLCLLDAMAQACMGRTNEAVMLAAYVFCQSGYKMRIGKTDGRLYLLYATGHCIYGKPYFRMDGDDYYVFNGNGASVMVA